MSLPDVSVPPPTNPQDACTPAVWFQDLDGDGFGDDTRPRATCETNPTDHVRRGGDCDDSDRALNPDSEFQAELGTNSIAFEWFGQPRLQATVPLTVTQASCSEPSATTSARWLSAEILGDTLVVTAEPPLPAGTTSAMVFVGGSTLQVQLRAVGAGAQPKALVIGIDGLRADAAAFVDTPALDRLLRHAAFTFRASTQRSASTVSGPGWTSLLTGVEPDKHRVVTNGGYALRNTDFPSFLWRANQAGLQTAVVVNWAPIANDILENDAGDTSFVGNDIEVAMETANRLRTENDDVIFVHFNDVDAAGHGSGFSGNDPRYQAAIERTDEHVATLLAAILERPSLDNETWMIVVSTDHGGRGTSHGPRDPDNWTIPLIVSSPSLEAGELVIATHMDIPPTVLEHVGVSFDPSWNLDGRPIGVPIESDCTNGIDDDGDGNIDCADADCSSNFACSCPEVDLGSSVGHEIASGRTSGADLEGSCGGSGADTTFAWTAPATDTYTFDLTGSARNYDTQLYVLDQCGGTERVCNDDTSAVQSAIQIDLQQGESIVLVVDGDSDGDSFELNVEPLSACPDGDLGNALGDPVVTGTIADTAGTFFASCGRSGRDHLYVWRAPSSGTFAFDTSGSDMDTVLHIRNAACGGDEIACDDDGGDGFASRTTATLNAGDEVTIVISGFNGRPDGPGPLPSGGSGRYQLSIEAE